jgi:hypothetical protein
VGLGAGIRVRISIPKQVAEKAFNGFFSNATREVIFSAGSHFLWLTAIENDGTSRDAPQTAKTEFFSSLLIRYSSNAT